MLGKVLRVVAIMVLSDVGNTVTRVQLKVWCVPWVVVVKDMNTPHTTIIALLAIVLSLLVELIVQCKSFGRVVNLIMSCFCKQNESRKMVKA